MRELGITRYTEITDGKLDGVLARARETYTICTFLEYLDEHPCVARAPHSGSVALDGELRRQGIIVQRERSRVFTTATPLCSCVTRPVVAHAPCPQGS